MWLYGLLRSEDWNEDVEDHATPHLVEPIDPDSERSEDPELT